MISRFLSPAVRLTGEVARGALAAVALTLFATLPLPVPHGGPGLAAAQEVPPRGEMEEGQEARWNTARVLELVGAGRAARQSTAVDPDFRQYSAQARGYVYFFIDREDRPEDSLVKTDQIALELYWRAPDQVKQRIVGLRDEKQLPTNIRYHLDHLTVVMDEFGDQIRMGDGDEVSSVLHPLAPDAESLYDYRLTDSVTVTLPGPTEPVRVYSVQVRPRFSGQPGVVGTLYLDRATAALVRMQFTFTPSSYVDPYLDYIRISLENGLWEGKYWLPYRQTAELRRELPQLDMPVGTIIRGRYEIGDYDFETHVPASLFMGPPVTALPEEQRRAFPFERGLYDQVDEEGLVPSPDLETIQAEAVEMIRNRALSGLRDTRFYFPGVSQIVRYDRAEGLYLGAGLSRRLTNRQTTELLGGYAFGRGRPFLRGNWRTEDSQARTTVSAYLNRPVDIGPEPGASGIFSTLSAATGNTDYTDLFFTSGARVSRRLSSADQGVSLEASAWWERHRSGRNEVDGEAHEGDRRPVLPVDDGDQWGGSLALTWTRGPWLETTVTGTVASHDGLGYGGLHLSADWRRDWRGSSTTVAARLRAQSLTPAAPAQAQALLGGRMTLPGFEYRAYSGDAFWLLQLVGARTLVHPWIRVRASAAAGQTGRLYNDAPPGWETLPTLPVRASLGAGLALAWDVLHLDLFHGVGGGGDWQFVISVDPRFWPWL